MVFQSVLCGILLEKALHTGVGFLCIIKVGAWGVCSYSLKACDGSLLFASGQYTKRTCGCLNPYMKLWFVAFLGGQLEQPLCANVRLLKLSSDENGLVCV